LIVLVGIISSVSIPKQQISKLELATNKILLNLNYIRYIAHIDNKYDHNDDEWEKKLWTMKFKRCSDTKDGLYYNVYSDMSGGTAHYKKSDCLKDIVDNKYLYSSSSCKPRKDENRYILLTKEYDVANIEISCNTTSTIGQISFGYDGKIYSQLGSNIKEITSRCTIKIYDKKGKFRTITIEPKTGFVHI
jgi:hypothetical protein